MCRSWCERRSNFPARPARKRRSASGAARGGPHHGEPVCPARRAHSNHSDRADRSIPRSHHWRKFRLQVLEIENLQPEFAFVQRSYLPRLADFFFADDLLVPFFAFFVLGIEFFPERTYSDLTGPGCGARMLSLYRKNHCVRSRGRRIMRRKFAAVQLFLSGRLRRFADARRKNKKRDASEHRAWSSLCGA